MQKYTIYTSHKSCTAHTGDNTPYTLVTNLLLHKLMTNTTLYTQVSNHSLYTLVTNYIPNTVLLSQTIYCAYCWQTKAQSTPVTYHSFHILVTQIHVYTSHKRFISHTSDKQYTIYTSHKPFISHTGDKQYTIYISHKSFNARTVQTIYCIQ